MVLAVLLAGGLLVRAPMAIVGSALAMWFLPLPFAAALVLVLAGVSIVVHRRTRSNSMIGEGDLLRHLSGRVSAGSSIRSAIADPSIDSVPDRARRLAALGLPMARVGAEMNSLFPVNGVAFQAICSFSEHTGAGISAALAVLAERADDATELARQRSVTLAQVKLSAVVVGLVPIAASMVVLALKGIPEPGGAVIVVPMAVGIALQLIGTFVVFSVASRATS
jgi:Flp pilus assembly protein TadB